MTDEPAPDHDMTAAAAAGKVLPVAVKVGAAAGGGRRDVRKQEKESVKYVTKTFPGAGSPLTQSNGQLLV